MTVEEHVSLAPLTTFRLGGSARFFICVKTVDDLKEALAFAKEKALRVFILGGGSNLLVSDAGFDGLVIKIELLGIEQQGATLVAGAGESWDALVARAVERGLWGIENLSGIYGTVGGGVVQNIGAYGAALSQTLRWVEVFDVHTGEVLVKQNTECEFGYRTSIFKKSLGRYVVLRAAFALKKDGVPNTTYKDLADIPRSNLGEIRAKVIAIRANKFPNLAKEGTAGSFFLNPVIPANQAKNLQERFPEMPIFTMPETANIKVPLGWILDHVLTMRGYRMGGARLFEKQTLVVVADHGTTASDVRALADKIKKEVKEKLFLDIEEEVCSV